MIKHAQSPILSDLKRELGSRLQLSVTSSRARLTAHPERYDLVIVDGDNLSPQALARQPDVGRATAAGRWVLALDARPADVGALSRYTGLAALPGEVRSARAAEHRTSMLLFGRGRVGHSQRTFILYDPQLDPYGSARLGAAERRRERARAAREAARLIANALAVKPSLVLSESAPQGDSGLPPEVQHVGWTIVQQGTVDTPNGSWTGDRQGIGAPTPGQQGSSWTINHSFDLYLDNAARPQGNFQVLTYNVSGSFNPADGGIFFQMYNPFQVGFTNNLILERAWWTGRIAATVGPQLGSQGAVSWQANNPSTPNQVNSYTSGNDFTIGFSAKDGPNASYSINNQHQNTISDWGVSSELAPNGSVAWKFTARNPCDARGQIADTNGCFAENTFQNGLPNQPNELSLQQIQFNASARWRTSSVLTGNAADLSFYVFAPIHLVDTYCNRWVVVICNFGASDRAAAGFDANSDLSNIPIDFSTVNPIPIKSLTFSPNPANGSAHQTVTGTVTLQRAAPMDITVLISSNSQNAVVGQPINGGSGSSTNVVIPKGASTGTFPILTNDNGLNSGGHTTAAISAFYTTDNVQQLQINSKKKR